jgi:hypothetical protein
MAWDHRCAPIPGGGAVRDGSFTAEECGAILERCQEIKDGGFGVMKRRLWPHKVYIDQL